MTRLNLGPLTDQFLPGLPSREKEAQVDFAGKILSAAEQGEPANGQQDRNTLADELKHAVYRRTKSADTARQFEKLCSSIPQERVSTLAFLNAMNATQSSSSNRSRASSSRPASASNARPETRPPPASNSRPSTSSHAPSQSTQSDAPPMRSTGAPPKSRQPSVDTTLMSMAQRLANHRSQLSASSSLLPISESELVKDALSIMAGHDGRYVRFKTPVEKSGPRRPFKRGEIIIKDEPEEPVIPYERSELEDGIYFYLNQDESISAPTRDLLHRLSEIGWLHNKVDRAIKDREGREVGMVEQSLNAALGEDITKYYELVAQLEGLRRDTTGAALTLRVLLVRTEDMKLRMRMMGTLVEEAARSIGGGALLTSIHALTSNGDPFIRDYSTSLLKTLSVPFFATLSSWIYEGELRDPFDEFFVELDSNASEGGNDTSIEYEGVMAHQLWRAKFSFRAEMLPEFLSRSFGEKIFSTGNSLNFLKYSCKESVWVSQRRSGDATRVLQYSDMAGLERSITSAYSVASQRLFDIFFEEFRLLDHLKALKDFVMLGKGDFVEVLMENLGPSLNRPANSLHRHNLTATLETAIRSSTSAKDEAVILRHLDARMLEFTKGELGWDVFNLEYKVDAPLDTILDPLSMEEYSKVFKHLWQIKRVEYSLTHVWTRLRGTQKLFIHDPSLAFQFHQTRTHLAEMTFFIRQLQSYCHLEVIACSWSALETSVLKKEGGLDSLIASHQTYLKRVVNKILLTSARRPSKKDPSPISMLEHVQNIFKIMLQYREAADTLCDASIAEVARHKDASRGNPIIQRLDINPAEHLQGIQGRLKDYYKDFLETTLIVVKSLEQSPDLDMKFLAVRLNFNLYFSGLISARKREEELRAEEQLRT